ncbi:MAG: hypothetical protein ACJ74Q_25400 [Pyrinomonadaceae bacterium]
MFMNAGATRDCVGLRLPKQRPPPRPRGTADFPFEGPSEIDPTNS